MPHTLSSDHTSASTPSHSSSAEAVDTFEVRLWLQEYEWLHGILQSPDNVGPTFRLPDLISAAVTLSLAQGTGCAQVFQFLGAELILRAPQAMRRREVIWRAQHEQLRALQRSPANRHPNPNFQLDQFATACVAQARRLDESGKRLLQQARLNMAERARRGSAAADSGTDHPEMPQSQQLRAAAVRVANAGSIAQP
jgi:hypothetical protein